jgi:serine/threonine-protein kinase
VSGAGPRLNLGRLAGLVRAEQDRSLGEKAVRAGLLDDAELAAAMRERLSVEELLRVRGVEAAEIERLRRSIDREEYAFFRPDRRLPPEVEEAAKDPERRLAEFVRVDRLGAGGVGEVWKAWDMHLGRWVALKLPAAVLDAEAVAKRFTREALAAARLSHPNIVAIHRVEEVKGRPFIVMQYVEGKPLNRVRLHPREALEALRTVALAVHYAHEQGVIHRDLKPGNIMIAADGRPFVLDFGLAHLQEAGREQSREGLVAGTAAYMSPEQARGDASARERGTDVYSLGATLYEVVAGRAPFDGASFAETVHRVIHEDPLSPRVINPAAGRHIEAIIHKAMDKDPRRRYASARELANDLDRCLLGEPVLAQGGTGLRTIRRWSRSHPKLLLGLAASFVALLAVAGLWRLELVRERRMAEEKAVKIRAIRDVSRVSLEAAMGLRRAGAAERIVEFVPRMESAYLEGVASAPSDGEIDYLMGRFQRAVLNEGRALELQGRALEKSPGFLPAVYEKLVLAAKAYDRRLAGFEERQMRQSAGGPLTAENASRLRRPGEKEALAADPVLAGMFEVLAQAVKAVAEGTGPGAERLGPGRSLAARGLWAFHRRNFREARELLSRAISLDPSLEEAWEALGEAWLSGGDVDSMGMVVEEALDHAERIFTHALVHDRGYAPHWAGRGRARGARAVQKAESGREPEEDFQAADDDFSEALRLAPTSAAWSGRARVRASRGAHRMRMGENPLPDWLAAEGDAGRALVAAPMDPSGLEIRGRLRRLRAEYRASRGEDPGTELQAFEREVPPGADPAPLGLSRGVLLALSAAHRAARGEHTLEEFARAEQQLDDALLSSPADAGLWERRAYVRFLANRARIERGWESPVDLMPAESDVAMALEIVPQMHQARFTRARLRRLRAGLEERGMVDPVPSLEAALAELADLLRQNPRSSEAWVERGHAELDLARGLQRRGDAGGARERYTQAVRHYEEAVRLNATLAPSLESPLREARRALLGS